MHRTETIDYGILLEGEITMLLDDSEVDLEPGDVVIQRGTNHAWENRSPSVVARIAFILIDGQFAGTLAEQLEGAELMRARSPKKRKATMTEAAPPLANATHDPGLRSWVPGADGHPDFPIQNLPLCIFTTEGGSPRGGVAIGDYILDLSALAESGVVEGETLQLVQTAGLSSLNDYCALGARERGALRAALSVLLSNGNSPLRNMKGDALLSQSDVSFKLPVGVGDYTDFFAGIHHARNAGKLFRPDNPLLPNYWHVPIAYHGRASSVAVSGTTFERPMGQTAAHGASEPHFCLSNRVDFELELAVWIGGGNTLGQPIAIEEAGEAIVGFGLLNDWSARDIQAWETQPLGPFLGKNFLTTVSPFLVTAEALAPFRTAMSPRSADTPMPLPYLWDERDQQTGVFDCQLEVLLATKMMRESGQMPVQIARASGLDLVWTPAQMVAHHTATGCNLRPGDLFGSGTVSGVGPGGHGSMLEMTSGGRDALVLPNGEARMFLEDGDEVILRGWCERDGFARIGLGEARGRLVANPRAPISH